MRNRKNHEKTSVRNHNNGESEFNLELIREAQECFDKNHLEQSNYLYQQVLRSNPVSVAALNGLGLIAMKAGMMSLAIEFLNSACENEPDNMILNKNLALALTRSSRYDEAILQYISMLDINENDSEVHAELAKLNKRAGNHDMALHYYRHAFHLNPEDPENFHGMVQINTKNITQDDIDIVENILNRSDLSLEKRSSFYYALGNIYDSRSLYDEAFANYSVANMCKCERFDSAEHTNYVTGIIDTFSTDLFDTIPSAELHNSKQPVFIVGMPYSGTTLVEKMLSSHSGVYAAGSSKLIEDIANNLDVTNEDTIKHPVLVDDVLIESLNDMADFYLSNINNQATKDNYSNPQLISNKVEINFTYLGLIALLFPDAKIIHCRRDPMDICLANFIHDLPNDYSYANDLRSVALYYQQYERLMAHWEKVLPIDIHTINYEEILTNTQSVSKKLIAHVNLEWQTKCLDFYTKNNTDGVTGGRYDNYNTSLKKWQSYDKYLYLLKETLGEVDDSQTSDEIVSINPHDFKKDYKVSKSMH